MSLTFNVYTNTTKSDMVRFMEINFKLLRGFAKKTKPQILEDMRKRGVIINNINTDKKTHYNPPKKPIVLEPRDPKPKEPKPKENEEIKKDDIMFDKLLLELVKEVMIKNINNLRII